MEFDDVDSFILSAKVHFLGIEESVVDLRSLTLIHKLDLVCRTHF